jgi:hypothetical protein
MGELADLLEKLKVVVVVEEDLLVFAGNREC